MEIESKHNASDIKQLSQKASTLEERLRLMELDAVSCKQKLENLEKGLLAQEADFRSYEERIRSGWSKFIWILGGSIVSGIAGWIMKGGLNHVN